jgi:tetratricopeptide (TPR) repeat protein
MPRASVERARQRLLAKDLAGARRECASILADAAALARDRAGAHLVLAACCQRGADDASALAHLRSAVGLTPDDPVARYALAELMETIGDKQGAIDALKRAIELNPAFVQAWNYLGILSGESGDAAGAAAAFEETVRLDPAHARGWNNLGNAQRTLGRLEDAARSFGRALAVRPDYPLAAANLATAQRDLGEVEQAEVTAREALNRTGPQPPYRPLLVILAGLLRERGAFDEAAQLYLQAIKAAPDQSAGEWISLGRVLTERGEPARARDAFAHAQATDPHDLRAALGSQLTLPMVYDDIDALETARSAFRQGLASLNREFDGLVGALSETEVLDGLRWTNFFLAYQGQDDRALQSDYATFAARAVDTIAPQWRTPIAPRRRPGSRIRVGFASAFFHVGTVGRYFCSWVT